MNSFLLPDFLDLYRALPDAVRHQARQAYALFRQDPHHPGLRFRQVHPVRPMFSLGSGCNQAAVLLAAGLAAFWWSQDLMIWLIHLVGEERALGTGNVVHVEGGGMLRTNLSAMIRWTVPVWLLGTVQASAALTLTRLWATRGPRDLPADGVTEPPVGLPHGHSTSP